jgi:hypothetical protein
MPPNHIGRWNRQGFERIATDFGWAIMDHRIEPLNIKETLKQQIAYRYLKVSQDPSSLASRIERINPVRIRRILRTLCAGMYALARLNSLLKAVSDNNRGDSQWVQFVKAGNSTQ